MSKGLEIEAFINHLMRETNYSADMLIECELCGSSEVLLIERVVDKKRIWVCDTCSGRIPRKDFYNPDADDYILFE